MELQYWPKQQRGTNRPTFWGDRDGSKMEGIERMGVVGLGYVGLPLALAATECEFDVVGVDVDTDRVQSLKRGNSYVNDVTDEELLAGLDAGFGPVAEYEALEGVDAVSVCVPTPMRKTGTPDLSYVVDATESLAEVVPQNCTVILESTVYPGATEEIVAEALSKNGWKVGEDVFVAFSPERIDPGNEEYGPTEIPKVIGGVTPACGDRAQVLYGEIFDELVRVDSATEAELVKLLENTFRAVNIGLINELSQIAHRLDVDIWNVIDAAATKPFGYMPFYPGPGLGGHCIPIDPMYLSWRANEQGIETRFIDLADTVNREMPRHVVHRVTDLLNADGVPLRDATVLVAGMAYKPNVSDVRESPAIDIIDMLEEQNVDVEYHDPHVDTVEIGAEEYASIPLSADSLAGADCTIVVTDHDAIDVATIVEHSPLVFDTRNATKGIEADHVHRL